MYSLSQSPTPPRFLSRAYRTARFPVRRSDSVVIDPARARALVLRAGAWGAALIVVAGVPSWIVLLAT